MMTVLPFVTQGASRRLAESATPHAATVFEPDRSRVSALVARALHRH